MDLVFEMDRAEKAKCPICDSTFSHLGNLRAHLIKKHGKSIEEAKVITSSIDEVRFECRLCQVKCRDRRVHETSKTHLKNVAKAKAKARFQRCDRRHVSSGSEDEAAVDVPAPKRRRVETPAVDVPAPKRRRVEKPQKRAPIEKNSQQAVARRVSEIPEVPDLDLINDAGNHRVRMVKQVKPPITDLSLKKLKELLCETNIKTHSIMFYRELLPRIKTYMCLYVCCMLGVSYTI